MGTRAAERRGWAPAGIPRGKTIVAAQFPATPVRPAGRIARLRSSRPRPPSGSQAVLSDAHQPPHVLTRRWEQTIECSAILQPGNSAFQEGDVDQGYQRFRSREHHGDLTVHEHPPVVLVLGADDRIAGRSRDPAHTLVYLPGELRELGLEHVGALR